VSKSLGPKELGSLLLFKTDRFCRHKDPDHVVDYQSESEEQIVEAIKPLETPDDRTPSCDRSISSCISYRKLARRNFIETNADLIPVLSRD
jgi:hypothetical protein